MQFPQDNKWTVSRFEKGYIFQTDAQEIEFDVTNVFNLIPKTRILKLEADADGILKIYTNSNFHADAFELRAGRVVIDIKDGIPQPESEFEHTSIIKLAPRENEMLHPKKQTSEIHLNQGTNFARLSDETLGSGFPDMQPSTQNSSIALSERLDSLIKEEDIFAGLEELLVTEISHAASRGLLEVNVPTIKTGTVTPKEPQSDLSAEQYTPEEDIDHLQHVHVQNPVAPLLERLQLNQNGIACIDNSELDISQWGPPLSEGLAFSSLRTAAVGEFDQPDSLGVENLAKYYLFLTFGSEAKTVLNEFRVSTHDVKFLNLIADIMESGFSTDFEVIEDQLECTGAAGFWSAMAHEHLPKGLNYEVDSIGAYFSSLPPHIRQHLGPTLSERYLEEGDVSTAKVIQSSILRIADPADDTLKLLNAEILLSDSNVLPAIKQIETIASADGPLAPRALIREIHVRAEEGLDIDPDLVEVSSILAREHRGTVLEGPLKHASILAKIHSGSSHVAVQDALSKQPQILSEQEMNSLLVAAAQKTVTASSDVVFVQTARSVANAGKLGVLPIDLKVAISERLINLGIYETASHYLSGLEYESDLSKIYTAKLEISRGNDLRALSYLSDNKLHAANELRAEILFRQGQTHSAADAFKLAGDSTRSLGAELISEDWNALQSSSQSSLSSIANLLLDDIAPDNISEENINISDLSLLLERSKETREAFGTLISQ
jgi:hypothetical protein